MNEDVRVPGLDIAKAMAALAPRRPVFHSERDLQHELAWQVHLADPHAQIRLETRPQRNVHLDLLIRHPGVRTAVEIKYLAAGLHAVVQGESFDLPNQSAQDIRRHDVVKDITRIETALADGIADQGAVIVLTNDRGYWQPPTRPDVIDAAFRLDEGRVLEGTLSWATRAGPGTTDKRDKELRLYGRYTCHWRDYSQILTVDGRTAFFRYLLITCVSGQATPAVAPASVRTAPASPARQPSAPTRQARTAREEILAAAHTLSSRSPDRSFTVAEIIAETRRAGSRYAEATIRTHVTSRMCGDAPDSHGTTYDDLERLDRGRYRLR